MAELKELVTEAPVLRNLDEDLQSAFNDIPGYQADRFTGHTLENVQGALDIYYGNLRDLVEAATAYPDALLRTAYDNDGSAVCYMLLHGDEAFQCETIEKLAACIVSLSELITSIQGAVRDVH